MNAGCFSGVAPMRLLIFAPPTDDSILRFDFTSLMATKLLLVGDERKNRRMSAWGFGMEDYQVRRASSRASVEAIITACVSDQWSREPPHAGKCAYPEGGGEQRLARGGGADPGNRQIDPLSQAEADRLAAYTVRRGGRARRDRGGDRKLSLSSAVGIEPRRHRAHRENRLWRFGATMWLTVRVSHVSDEFLVFSSVCSVPLWFNCGL